MRAVLPFDRQCHLAGLPRPVAEFRFAPPRRWRFDWAFTLPYLLAVEVEGGAWVGGRHTRGAGFVKDMEKYNAATLQGWKVLRVVPKQIADGSALMLVERAIRGPRLKGTR